MTNSTPDKKVTVSMPQSMANEIRAYVDTGEFSSTSEVVRDAIRVWQRQRLEDLERLAVIRARIRASLDDPRDNLSAAEVRARMSAIIERARETERDASAKR